MITHDAFLPTTVLQRKAEVHVRKLIPQQVQSNLESQRRQYELLEPKQTSTSGRPILQRISKRGNRNAIVRAGRSRRAAPLNLPTTLTPHRLRENAS
jgi:hypothetical protein